MRQEPGRLMFKNMKTYSNVSEEQKLIWQETKL